MAKVILSFENPPQVGDWFLVGGKKAVFTSVGRLDAPPEVSWEDGFYFSTFRDYDWIDLEVTRPAKKVTGELVGLVTQRTTGVYFVKGVPLAEVVKRLGDQGKQTALVILEDGE